VDQYIRWLVGTSFAIKSIFPLLVIKIVHISYEVKSSHHHSTFFLLRPLLVNSLSEVIKSLWQTYFHHFYGPTIDQTVLGPL